VRKRGAASGRQEKRTERFYRQGLNVAMTDQAKSCWTCTNGAVNRVRREWARTDDRLSGRRRPVAPRLLLLLLPKRFYFRFIARPPAMNRPVEPGTLGFISSRSRCRPTNGDISTIRRSSKSIACRAARATRSASVDEKWGRRARQISGSRTSPDICMPAPARPPLGHVRGNRRPR
jgi:hypothetical protein